jgi:hypothetical protein
MAKNNKSGEVVEASTTSFTAQCYKLFECPPLGSLVKTSDGDEIVYGIVAGALSGGLDPSRRPIARGQQLPSEESLFKENPQLEKLLVSQFNVLVIGHKSEGNIYHYLPPRPARIHGFVYPCGTDEITEFSSSFGFLSLILGHQSEVPAEELAAACLRQMSRVQQDSHTFLVKAGKEMAVLLAGDSNRLRIVLERIKR